jgi:hypothetical protein
VALGVANACVRELARRGLVKIRGSNNRTLTYHLTKRGVLHKAGLAVLWTANTIEWYVQARRQVAEQLESIHAHGVSKVLFWGANEVTEHASIVALQVGLQIAGVVEGPCRAQQRKNILGAEVQDLAGAQCLVFDAVIACDDPTPEELATLRASLGNVPVFTVSGEEL